MLVVLGPLKFVRECVTLFFHGVQCFCHGELPCDLTGIEPGLQLLNLGVLRCGSFLQFAGGLSLGKFDGIPLVLLGQLKPLVQLLLELVVANLLEDVCVPGLVNFECFPAVRANDLVHAYAPPAFFKICLNISGTVPSASIVTLSSA